jgi:hypothetical protein
MHTPPQMTPAVAPSALSTLLTRYVAGQIGDTTWERFMEIFDTGEATQQERLALAAFYSDALEEMGVRAIKVPVLEELQELLAETRVA